HASPYRASTHDHSDAGGNAFQYPRTIDVDVGLHHASPPPSYCGYWPAWISCEYAGTCRSTVFVIVVAEATYGFVLIGSDATAPRRVTVGVAVDPAARRSVTLNWYDPIGWSF